MSKLLDYCYRCEAPIVTKMSIPRERRLCETCKSELVGAVLCSVLCASQHRSDFLKTPPCDCGLNAPSVVVNREVE